MARSTSQFFDEVLGERAGVKKELANVHDLAWDVVDKALLSLCKLRIAMILGCDEEVESARQYLDLSKADAIAQWSSSNFFTGREKSCLRFTEEFIIDVSSIPDASAVAGRRATALRTQAPNTGAFSLTRNSVFRAIWLAFILMWYSGLSLGYSTIMCNTSR